MKKIYYLCRSLLLFSLSLWSYTGLNAQEMTPSQAYRLVKTANSLHLSQLEATATTFWVVAQVRPGKGSGTLYVKSGYIDADSGQFVQKQSSVPDYVECFGVVRIVETLSGKHLPKTLNYRWREAPSGAGSGDPLTSNPKTLRKPFAAVQW